MYEGNRVFVEKEVAHGPGAEPSWREAHQQLQRIARGAARSMWTRQSGCSSRAGRARIASSGTARSSSTWSGRSGPRRGPRANGSASRRSSPSCRSCALERGATTYSAVRELTRVAEPETEADLIASATGKTVREIEDFVAGDEPRTRRLAMELQPRVYPLFLEAKRMLRGPRSAMISNRCCGHACGHLAGPASVARPIAV